MALKDLDPIKAKELKEKDDGLTLYAWATINTLINIYNDDKGLVAPGDDTRGLTVQAPQNKLNHFRSILISQSGQLSRYREDRSNQGARGIIFNRIVQPTLAYMKKHGTAFIPDQNLCSGYSVSQTIMEDMGLALYDSPYTFQILRSWFLPPIVTYNNVTPDLVCNLVNDFIIETWCDVLALSGEELAYRGTLEHIAENARQIQGTSLKSVLDLNMHDDHLVNNCVMINQVKAMIASAAVRMVFKICMIFGWPPIHPEVSRHMQYLQSIKAQV